MMETIITHANLDYRMAVVYNKQRDQYVLQFTSLSDDRGSEHGCRSFSDARNRFMRNVRFYHGTMDVSGVPLTEEQFLGVTPGLLGPNPKADAAQKEVY